MNKRVSWLQNMIFLLLNQAKGLTNMYVPYVLSLQIFSIPPFSSFNPSLPHVSLPPVNKIPWLMPVNWISTHHTLQHSQHLLWIRNVNPPPPPPSLSLGFPLSSNVCSPPLKRESKSPFSYLRYPPTDANLDNQCRLYRRRRRLLSRRISSMMKRAPMSTEYSIGPSSLSPPRSLSLCSCGLSLCRSGYCTVTALLWCSICQFLSE